MWRSADLRPRSAARGNIHDLSRSRLRPLLPLLPAAAALAASGCGGSGGAAGAPSVNAIVNQALVALAPQSAVRYALDASLRLTPADRPSTPQSGLIQSLFSKPLRIKVAGGYQARRAVTANIGYSFAGHSGSAIVLYDRHARYVQVLGSWFGDGKGLSNRRSSSGGGHTAAILAQAEANGAIRASVSAGPRLDGVDTWQAKGRIDPSRLEQAAVRAGKAYGPGQMLGIEAVLSNSTFTLAVGRRDGLPRRIGWTFDVDSAKLASLLGQSTTAQRLNPFAALFKHVAVTLTVDLGSWGQPVTLSRPSSFLPLSQLRSKLTQALRGLIVPGLSGTAPLSSS